MKQFAFLVSLLLLAGCSVKPTTGQEQWISLFNGQNLDGWTVKIAGFPVGENYANTFYVEDGLLKVSYAGYENGFNDHYGHIYTNDEYSHYKLRVEYRFTGQQAEGGPGWAYMNNGAMLHAQAPETMRLHQDFPASIEAQLLGNDTDEGDRPTGNVCTPGTEVYIEGSMYPAHCANSSSKCYRGDQWVTLEMEVHADSIVHHIVEGDTVMTYTRITLDDGTPLRSGRIALQAESHPTEFRKIELLDLSK